MVFGGPEVLVISIILLFFILLFIIMFKKAFEGRKKTVVVLDVKKHGKVVVEKKCPNCGGTLTELNFFKLKAGNDAKCDYCNVIISSGS